MSPALGIYSTDEGIDKRRDSGKATRLVFSIQEAGISIQGAESSIQGARFSIQEVGPSSRNNSETWGAGRIGKVILPFC